MFTFDAAYFDGAYFDTSGPPPTTKGGGRPKVRRSLIPLSDSLDEIQDTNGITMLLLLGDD